MFLLVLVWFFNLFIVFEPLLNIKCVCVSLFAFKYTKRKKKTERAILVRFFGERSQIMCEARALSETRWRGRDYASPWWALHSTHGWRDYASPWLVLHSTHGSSHESSSQTIQRRTPKFNHSASRSRNRRCREGSNQRSSTTKARACHSSRDEPLRVRLEVKDNFMQLEAKWLNYGFLNMLESF